MSKGIIKSVVGAGEYTVQVQIDLTRYTVEKAQLEKSIAAANANEVAQTTAYAVAKAAANAASAALDAAINAYSADPTDANRKEVDDKQGLFNEAIKVERAALNTLNATKIEQLRLGSRLAEINQVALDAEDWPAVTAWCVDFTDGLQVDQEVGLIDLGRQYGKNLPYENIIPGGINGDEADYNRGADGAFQSYHHADPYAVFYNSATLPGYNKWKPLYRKGEIKTIDKVNDTCVVTLDNLVSTNQSLDVNQTAEVTANIIYLSCNSQVFDVGDRVVVAFNSDWNTPEVIGFESNPRKCIPDITLLYEQRDPNGVYDARFASVGYISHTFAEIGSIFWFEDLVGAGSPDIPTGGDYTAGKFYTSRATNFVGVFPDFGVGIHELEDYIPTVLPYWLQLGEPDPPKEVVGKATLTATSEDRLIVYARYAVGDEFTELSSHVHDIIQYDISTKVELERYDIGNFVNGILIQQLKLNGYGFIYVENSPVTDLGLRIRNLTNFLLYTVQFTATDKGFWLNRLSVATSDNRFWYIEPTAEDPSADSELHVLDSLGVSTYTTTIPLVDLPSPLPAELDGFSQQASVYTRIAATDDAINMVTAFQYRKGLVNTHWKLLCVIQQFTFDPIAGLILLKTSDWFILDGGVILNQIVHKK